VRGTTIPTVKIAVLPGDGIGSEVTKEAVKVLEATGLDFEFIECLVGGAAYIENGDPLPQEARDVIEESATVLFGAVGHDYAPYGVPRKVLAYLRVEKDAYANVRPLKLYPGINGPSPDHGEVDVVIIRDNSEGTALEHEGYLWEDKGLDKRVITSFGARRISSFAFKYAHEKGRERVTCVDLSGWLYGDQLFRRSFLKVAKLLNRVESDCVSVDIAAMIQASAPALIATVGWQTPELLDSYHRALDLCRSADAPPDLLRRPLLEQNVAYRHGPRRRYEIAVHVQQQGGFPRAIGAYDPDGLSMGNAERDALEGIRSIGVLVPDIPKIDEVMAHFSSSSVNRPAHSPRGYRRNAAK